MNTKLFYALIWAFCGIVFQLVLFFSGFQTEKLATGQYLQWLGLPIGAVILYLALKAVRDERPDRTLSYGQRVGAGTLISLYTGLISALYTWFHFKFVNVNFAEYTIAMSRSKWAARGLSPSQMDQAETFTRSLLRPEIQAVLTPVMSVIFGVVLSLIVAAFVESKPAGTDAAPSGS